LKRLSRSAFESDGSHVTLYILNVNGVTELQPCFWKNQDEKMESIESLKKMIASGELREYVFIAEAWLVEKQLPSSIKEVTDHIGEMGSLEDYPDRKESLIIEYSSFKTSKSYVADIRRDGDKVTLGDWETWDESHSFGGLVYGKMQNLFELSKAGLN
jgi:hypothetical protein